MEEHQKYTTITRQIMFSYGNLLVSFIFSPLLIFLLTRNLTLEEYGIYSLLSLTVMVLSVMLELGFSQYLITKYSGVEKTKKAKTLSSLIIFDLLVLILFALLFFLTPLQNLILGLLGLPGYGFEFKIVLLIAFIISLHRIVIGYLSSEKRIELINVLDSLKDNLWIVLLIAFFLITGSLGLFSVVLLWIGGVAVAFFIGFSYIRKDFIKAPPEKLVDFKVIKNGLSFGIPIIPFFLGSWIIAIGDRYILSHYMGAATVGIYSLAYTLAVVVANLGIAVLAVFYPYIAENWNQKKDYSLLLNAALKYGLVIVIPSLVGLFCLRSQIITLIAGVPYKESVPILAVLLSFPFFLFSIFLLSRILMLKSGTKLIAVMYLVGAALNIALNLLLIPKIGMYGAAIATIVVYFLIFISMYFLCKKHLQLNYKYLKIPSILLASLIMGVALEAINPQVAITKIFTILFGIIVYFALLFLFNGISKQEIEFLKRVFLRREASK